MIAAVPGPPTAFAFDDAWLLASVLKCSRRGRQVSVEALLDEMDFVMRDVPSYEAFSEGIPRLEAAGLITHGVDTSGRLWLRPTDAGRIAGRDAFPFRIRHLTYSVERVADALGVESYVRSLPDRGLDLRHWDRQAYERAVRAYRRAFDAESRFVLSVRGCLLSPFTLLWGIGSAALDSLLERAWLFARRNGWTADSPTKRCDGHGRC